MVPDRADILADRAGHEDRGEGIVRNVTAEPAAGLSRRRQVRLSRYAIAGPVFDVGGSEPQRLVFSTRSTRLGLVPDRQWQALERGEMDAVPPAFVQAMLDNGFAVPVEEDELRAVLAENRQSSGDAAELVQVLQPSAACQLGCTYCGQAHQASSLSAHRQEAILARIRDRLSAATDSGKPFESLNVGWFGAEPLLGMGAIRAMSPRLSRLADEFDCAFSARVITNGLLLTTETATELQSHGVKYVEVTLDGTESVHDARRATKGGRGSFATIMANLTQVASNPNLGFELVVRTNVDASNADDVPRLIDLLARNGINKRAKLYFSPVYSWGNDAHLAALTPEVYAWHETQWLNQMFELGFALDPLPERHRIVCLALQRDGRVTDAFGTEFNCTEAPLVPAYGAPNRYAVGHVDDANGNGVSLPFATWYDEIEDGTQSACASCRMLPVCGGACPKAWLDGNPPCPSTKHNIVDRMSLALLAGRQAAPGNL